LRRLGSSFVKASLTDRESSYYPQAIRNLRKGDFDFTC
jgi:hypothetical protein